MDEREADAVWKRFTDTDRAAKRGHGIGFSSGQSEPFEGSFHVKDSLEARFKRADAPQNEVSAKKEPVTARERIRARVANAIREGKQHQRAEDSKWTEFTTQKRRELVGLQSIVDDRGRMLGTEYDFSEQDHAELENAIATAARNPDTAKKVFDDDHAAAMFGDAREPQHTRPRSPRDSELARDSRYKGGHRDRGYDRIQGRNRERSGREEYTRAGGDRAHADRRDYGKHREDRSKEMDRRRFGRDRQEHSSKRSHSRSPDRRASPGHSRYRDRHCGYSRSIHERDMREDRGYGRERGESHRRQDSHDERPGGHDREMAAYGKPSDHRKHGHDSRCSGSMGSRDSNTGSGVRERMSRSGRAHNDGDRTGARVRASACATGTAGMPQQGDGSPAKPTVGAAVPAWEGLVPEGAVVVELEEATAKEPEERHTDLDAKFQNLAKSSWRDRLAARS